MVVAAADVDRAFQTDIPARMDRLPWSRWHWLVITALGITWIIDGLEVTMIAAFGAVLQEPESLHFSSTQIGLSGHVVPGGCRSWGAGVRLPDRPARPQEAVHRHAGSVPGVGVLDGVFMELRELRIFPLSSPARRSAASTRRSTRPLTS